MKKTFISPVADFVVTEAVEMIATSTFGGDKINNDGTNGGDKSTNPSGITNDARSNGNVANPSKPSISAYELN